MEKKLTPADAARLWTNCYDSDFAENQCAILIEEFQLIIRNISIRYHDPTWQADLVQEGNIGLLNAMRKFPAGDNRNKFLGYAINAIKNSMTDFVRAKWKKSPIYFVSSYSTDADETRDYYANRLTTIDYHTTTSWPVNVTYHLDSQDPKRIGLSDRDIQIWDLYEKRYTLLEIAQIIHLSSSYTAKLISRIKAQMRRLYE